MRHVLPKSSLLLRGHCGPAPAPAVRPVPGIGGCQRYFSKTADPDPQLPPPESQPLIPEPGALPPAGSPETFGQRALAQINDFRLKLGLHALQWDARLARLAHDHCLFMDQRGKLGHDHFEQRCAYAKGGACVENIAWNMNTPQALLDNWTQQAAQAQNLTNPTLRKAGIARVGFFVTFFACEKLSCVSKFVSKRKCERNNPLLAHFRLETRLSPETISICSREMHKSI